MLCCEDNSIPCRLLFCMSTYHFGMRPIVSILILFFSVLPKIRLRTLPTCFFPRIVWLNFCCIFLIYFFHFWDEAERFYSNFFAEVKDRNGSKIFFLGDSLVEFLLERGINRKCKK